MSFVGLVNHIIQRLDTGGYTMSVWEGFPNCLRNNSNQEHKRFKNIYMGMEAGQSQKEQIHKHPSIFL